MASEYADPRDGNAVRDDLATTEEIELALGSGFEERRWKVLCRGWVNLDQCGEVLQGVTEQSVWNVKAHGADAVVIIEMGDVDAYLGLGRRAFESFCNQVDDAHLRGDEHALPVLYQDGEESPITDEFVDTLLKCEQFGISLVTPTRWWQFDNYAFDVKDEIAVITPVTIEGEKR